MKQDTSFSNTEKIGTLFCHIIFIAVLISGVALSYFSFAKGSLVYLIFGALPCGVILAGLFIRFYLPGISESIAFSFFLPRKFLKKAPVVLSPYIGMITNGEYQRAFDGLEPVVKENPGNPDVVLLFARSCMFLTGKEKTGFSVMEQYFSLKDREPSRNHLKLLFFYADKAIEYQYTDHLIPILTKEYEKVFYTNIEKQAIRIRLDSIRRG